MAITYGFRKFKQYEAAREKGRCRYERGKAHPTPLRCNPPNATIAKIRRLVNFGRPGGIVRD